MKRARQVGRAFPFTISDSPFTIYHSGFAILHDVARVNDLRIRYRYRRVAFSRVLVTVACYAVFDHVGIVPIVIVRFRSVTTYERINHRFRV